MKNPDIQTTSAGSQRPWQAEALDGPVAAVPAMLTPEERRYLIWLTRTQFRGQGAVVDLGPWLGASSAALAEGLARGGKTGRVESIDLFSWSRFYMQAPGVDLEDGADFQFLYRQLTKPWSDRTRSTKADLLQHQWTGGPIEILFVDAAKSWELTAAILKNFGPHLIPGVTRIVFQDFADETTYFLPLVVDSCPDVLREVEAVEDGTTVSFLVQPGGVVEKVAEQSRTSLFPLERATKIMRRRAEAHGGIARARFLAQLCRRAAEDLELADLHRIDAEILAAYPAFERWRFERIHDASGELVSRGWTALDSGNIEQAADLARRSVAVAPQHPWCWGLQAAVAMRREDVATFDEALERLRHHPERPDFLMFHAAERLRRGDWVRAEALSLATLVKFAAPTSHVLWAISVLATAWREMGYPITAWSTLQNLPTGLSAHVDYWLLRGALARAGGRHEELRECIGRATEMAPNDPRLRELREPVTGKTQ